MYEYSCPEPITVDTRIAAGTLTIVAEPRDSAHVEISPHDDSEGSRQAAAATRVHRTGDRLRIETPDGSGGWLFRRSGRVRIDVRVPLDCRLLVRTGSAQVDCSGRYESGDVTSGSADIRVGQVTGDLAVKTGSGDVDVDRVDGRLSCDFASGEARVGHVGGTVTAHSASGDLEILSAGDSVRATTASGHVRIGAARSGTVKVHSASGEVTVGVARGTRVWLDLVTVSGHTATDLAMAEAAPGGGSPDLTIQIRTASGDINVHRAPMPARAAA
jgi:DUF4097 and DUF4098 domain-containing protein YvlB